MLFEQTKNTWLLNVYQKGTRILYGIKVEFQIFFVF